MLRGKRYVLVSMVNHEQAGAVRAFDDARSSPGWPNNRAWSMPGSARAVFFTLGGPAIKFPQTDYDSLARYPRRTASRRESAAPPAAAPEANTPDSQYSGDLRTCPCTKSVTR